jgi:hypothetical protein
LPLPPATEQQKDIEKKSPFQIAPPESQLEQIRRQIEEMRRQNETEHEKTRKMLTKIKTKTDDDRGSKCRIADKNIQLKLPKTDENGQRIIEDVIDWRIENFGAPSSIFLRIQALYDYLFENPPQSILAMPESYVQNVNNDVPTLILIYGSYRGQKWISTSRSITIANPRPNAHKQIQHHTRHSGPAYCAIKLESGKRVVAYDRTAPLARALATRLASLSLERAVSQTSGIHSPNTPPIPLSLRAIQLFPEGRKGNQKPRYDKRFFPNGQPDPRYPGP